MDRAIGPEAAKAHKRRLAEGFYEEYLSGKNILDIGYRGGKKDAQPITHNAVGIDLDYPNYDGINLPFPDQSQDAIFSSHCLEHIAQYRIVLVDWYRALRVGGFLIIIVPHRDLYERKRFLPSRFNADHKRFYTPANLLAEIEESLPVGGYRLRLLRDIDAGFNYTFPPEQHATGFYEIELVVEKIAIPSYASELRPPPQLCSYAEFFSSQMLEIVNARRCGNFAKQQEATNAIKNLPAPPIKVILQILYQRTGELLTDEVKWVMKEAFLAAALSGLDLEFYKKKYKDLADFSDEQLKNHYTIHGFAEGRKASPCKNIFD